MIRMIASMIATRTDERGVASRVLLLVLIASFAIDAWAQVGYVHALSGSATSQRGSQRPVSTRVGDTFEAGTVFSTSGEGRLTLKFTDGQIVALGPGSIARVDQYRFDERNIKASSLAIGLQDGSLRLVGGAIATGNREAVRLSAGESRVSILRSAGGIDFTVMVNTKGQEVGVAAVTVGEVAVRTPYGPILRIEADQAVPWRPGATPRPPIPIAAAPAAVQAELAGLRSMLLPGNTPVAVDVAARAAVASASRQQPGLGAKAGAAPAGYVHALSGSAVAQEPSGRSAPVRVGDTFDVGATFSTADDGRVVLKFADGQILVLGSRSIARVDQCQFDARNVKASGLAIRLQDGILRFVGGAIATENREAVRMSAGESLVSILRSAGGIDFTVMVNTKEQEVGLAAVTLGEVAVRTPYGPILRIAADQAVPWRPGAAPSPPVPTEAAPTAFLAQLAGLRSMVLPDNTPVDIDVAAIAANDLVQRNLEAQLAALPATTAGPADFSASPIFPIPVVTGGGGRCVGSPC